jgi:hypothetical protein
MLLLQQLPQSAMVFLLLLKMGYQVWNLKSFGDGLFGTTKRSLGCSELFQLLTN